MKVLEGRSGFQRADEAYWLHLLRECREHSWRRRQKLRRFSSRSDWEEHCRTVRERFRNTLGPLPERTPLNPRRVGVLERDGYVVEKLIVESQPQFYVTVNLYLPTRVTFPAPAVLNPLGHWYDSKAEEVVQARAIGLARKGYVALVYDPIGQGERSQFWDAASNKSPIDPSTAQHSAVCNPCFLIGQTVINHMVWDGIRMLDYLETRPEVDASRIGCTGASGGGTYTMFLSAVDSRIKAAVPVCSTSTYERMLAQGQIGEPCQDPVAGYRDDLDMADLLMCAAPTPVLIVAATYDFLPLIGAREVYLDVSTAYTALGIPERVGLFETPSQHNYNKPMREAMYAWFNRWLGHEAEVAEAPFQAEPPDRLWCTSTGQLLTSIGGETVLTLNRQRTRELAAPPTAPQTVDEAEADRRRIRSAVPEVLGYVDRPPFSAARTLDRVTVDGLAVEQIVFETEPDLPIPGLIYLPPLDGPHPSLLFLHDRGKGIECTSDGLVPALARVGYLVAAVDLRGWGETAWWRRFPYDRDDFGLLGNDSMLAYVGYLLGQWALTQRVADAIRTVDVLTARPDVDASRLGVIGRGGAGLVALHAAALDPRLKGVATYEMLATYRSITEADRYTHPVSSFVPGVLLHYDLPDLVGALAPAPALIANPVDAMGEVLHAGAASETYRGAERAYELFGGAGRLQLDSEMSRSALADAIERWAGRVG